MFGYKLVKEADISLLKQSIAISKEDKDSRIQFCNSLRTDLPPTFLILDRDEFTAKGIIQLDLKELRWLGETINKHLERYKGQD